MSLGEGAHTYVQDAVGMMGDSAYSPHRAFSGGSA